MACKLPPPSSLSSPPPWLQRLPTKNPSVVVKPTGSEKHISPCRASPPENVTEEETSSASSSARNQLDLLQQLASSTSTSTRYEGVDGGLMRTIREQLSEAVGGRGGDFTLPLGKKLKALSLGSLTVSQRRNIKRQAYLNEVEQRNDSAFFATVGAFVLLPPLAILAAAVATGYVQLFP